MKVYVVSIDGSGISRDIEGVYSSKDKAQELLDYYESIKDKYPFLLPTIVELELDAEVPELYQCNVTRETDGRRAKWETHLRKREVKKSGSQKTELTSTGYARTPEEAQSIAVRLFEEQEREIKDV